MSQWIQKAVSKMKKKGTIGSFGKATESKIVAGKKIGGLEEKRAVFAQNMKEISEHRKSNYKPGDAVSDRESRMKNC